MSNHFDSEQLTTQEIQRYLVKCWKRANDDFQEDPMSDDGDHAYAERLAYEGVIEYFWGSDFLADVFQGGVGQPEDKA